MTCLEGDAIDFPRFLEFVDADPDAEDRERCRRAFDKEREKLPKEKRPPMQKSRRATPAGREARAHPVPTEKARAAADAPRNAAAVGRPLVAPERLPAPPTAGAAAAGGGAGGGAVKPRRTSEKYRL